MKLILPFYLGVFLIEVRCSQLGNLTDKDFTTILNISPNLPENVHIDDGNSKRRVITINRKSLNWFDNFLWDGEDEAKFKKKKFTRNSTSGKFELTDVDVPKNLEEMNQIITNEVKLDCPQADSIQSIPTPLVPLNYFPEVRLVPTPGLYTLSIGYYLKQNLLNAFGYIMYQPVVNLNRKLFLDLSNLKSSIQLDHVDVFRLIPHLPGVVNRSISDQFQMILDVIVYGLNTCQVNCINDRWRGEKIDLDAIFSHWNHNPFFNGIIDVKKGRSVGMLEKLGYELQIFPRGKNGTFASMIFSPVIVSVLEVIQQEKECLTESLMGYLLGFYPFPDHDIEVDMAINQLTMTFIDEVDDTAYCRVFFHRYNGFALKPIELLKMITERIIESFCPMYLKAPAKTIRRALDDKLTIPNYRNILNNRFVSLGDLGKLLNQIDLRTYPVEVVTAKERVRDFAMKILPYLNYQDFPLYKFHTKEEALMAFLTFLQVKIQRAPLMVKASVNAIKAHFQFSKGPRALTHELFVSVLDAWLAPDLHEEITNHAYELKLFVLDEGSEIRRVLSRQQRVCGDVLQCFIKATSVLRNDEVFSKRSLNLKIPACIIYRYLNTFSRVNRPRKIDLATLLEVITPQSYRREILLAANRLRDFVSDKDLVPGFDGSKFCTKQETLVAYLEQAVKNANYPREIYDSIKALIPSVAFKIRQIRQVNVKVVHEITKAFTAPDNDEVAVHQMLNVANFMAVNEVVIDTILDRLNPVKCNDVHRCYNQIAEILNKQNFTSFVFPKFRMYSPELYVLNLGFDVSSMNVDKLTRIVAALTENTIEGNNELDAAILYISLTAHLIDPYLNMVNCNDKQVLPCFESMMFALRQNQHKIDAKINVFQFVLTPSICDRRYCQWLTHYEQGSTILNPILEYIKFLTVNFSGRTQHFHVRLEMEKLHDHLSNANVDGVLSLFKVKMHSSDLDAFIAFLTLLSRSLSLEDPMINDIENIVNYYTLNIPPKYFTFDNFRGVVKYLEKSAPPLIYCEMNSKLRLLLSEENDVIKFFKSFEIDCSTLENCIVGIENHVVNSMWVPYSGTILQIIRPDLCYETRCDWTKDRFKTPPKKYMELRERLHLILINIKRAPDNDIPLIVKLLVDVLLKDDRLAFLLHVINGEDIEAILNQPQASDVLYNFLEVILMKYNPPPDISPSLKHLYNYLKHNTMPMNLNHETLINLLIVLNRETKDDVVRTQINILEDLIVQKMAIINAELTKLEIACVSLEQCLRKLYEKTQMMNNVKLQKFLHQILLAPGCALAHCPKKISVSKQAADDFIRFILERIDGLKDSSGCTYHLLLDIDFIRNIIAAHGTDIVTSHLLYKRKDPDVVFFLLNEMLNQPNIPREVSLSVSNILNFFLRQLTPTYIHVHHLNNIATQLQQQVQDESLRRKFASILENLESRASDINRLLVQMPVNCTTFKNCLISLYLRLLRENKTGLVQYLMEMFAPIGCNEAICPWLVEFPARHVEQVKFELINQINAFNVAECSLQLQADFGVLKQILLGESLDDIYAILGIQGNVNLVPFLEALGPNILMKYDALECQKNAINYIVKGEYPHSLELNGLKSLGEMFYNLTTDNLIRNDLQEAMNDLAMYTSNVRSFLHKAIVNCTNFSLCIQTIYDNVQVFKNDPMSVIVKNLLFPQSCTKITCPWILEESIEISLDKLRKIKSAISHLIDSETIPLIIGVQLENLRGELLLENTKDLLPMVDTRKSGFLVEFIKELYRYPHIHEDYRLELTNLIAYFANGSIPDKLTLKDYRGLVRIIKRLAEDTYVVYELTQLEKKVERYPKVIENILTNCPVECTKLHSCINSIKDCLTSIKSPYAKIILEQICPLKSQDGRCSKVDYGREPLSFPGKLFYPNQMIFFVNINGVLRHSVLDLTDQSVILQLNELPPIETFYSQIAMLEFRDNTGINRRIAIDLNNRLVLDRILGINPNSNPTIDFGTPGSTIVYVPTENGKLVPLKLDHSISLVRESLKLLIKHQIRNGFNPEINIIDFDGSSYTLAIDVNDNALWKSLLKISSDSIHVDSTFLLSFPGNYGNSWRSVLITNYDVHTINILQNLPIFDEVNTVEAALGVTGGMVQLCFNVFDSWVNSALRSLSKLSRVPIIDTREIFSLLLGVPDRLGNIVPLRINVNDSRYIEALVKTSKQLACTTGCQPTFILQTDSESIPLHLNFDNPLALFILIEELNAVDKTFETSRFRIIVIQDNLSKEFIILNLDNYLVSEWLEDLSKIPDPSGDRITIRSDDGSCDFQVAINRNNPLVMQYLKQLMEKTLCPIPPTEVIGGDGRRYIALTIVDETGKLIPVVIELNTHNIQILEGISQPYNTAAFEINIDRSITIKLEPNDRNILKILSMLKQGEMSGIATETSYLSNTGDLIIVPIMTQDGKYKVLFFETRKPHVYENLKETCNDTSKTGRSIVLTRPNDGQMEIVYCDISEGNEDRLKRHADRIRDKLHPQMTVIMTIPDKTGMLHPFILDLSNSEVVRQLRYFTSIIDPASENKIAIDYIDNYGTTEIFMIDLNEVTIDHIQKLCDLTPASIVPIQKIIDGHKMIIATYPGEKTRGQLILNVTDVRTQEILTAISDPGNPLATKITMETAFGKIDVFVDFDDVKHLNSFRELCQISPLIPAPLLVKRPQGLLQLKFIDQYGRSQIVMMNVTDRDVLDHMIGNPAKPKMAIIDSYDHLQIISVDVEDEQWAKIGSTIYKPDKNTLVAIDVGRPIVLDLTQPEIREILKSIDTGNARYTPIILPGNDRRCLYIDLTDQRTQIVLKEAQMWNTPNLYPTIIPTYDSHHRFIVFTIQIDDKKTRPIIIDNNDFATIKKLIELSDKSNPSCKLITITDSNGMTYPLYLDLNDLRIQEILIAACENVKLPNSILTNTDEKIEKYLELPIGGNRFTRCDLTNPFVIDRLVEISRKSERRSICTTVSIVNPITKDSIVLTLDLNEERSVETIVEICEKQIFIQPNPSSTLVVYVKSEGSTRPIIMNLESESTQELLENLNQINPGETGSLIQFVGVDGHLKFYKVDFESDRTQRLLQEYYEKKSTFISPTIVNTADGYQALVLTVFDDKNSTTPLYISLDNTKTFSVLRSMSNPQDINAIPILLTDLNGYRQIYYIDAYNSGNIDRLRQLSWESSTHKSTIPYFPTITAYNQTSMAVLDGKGRVMIFTLDLTNPWVLQTISDMSTTTIDKPDGTTIPIVIPTFNGTRVVRIDSTSEKLISVLETISINEEFKSNPGDLIVLPSEKHPIILDIVNELVIQTIIEVSQATSPSKATHTFVIADRDQTSRLIKLNLHDSKVMSILEHLSRQTPRNLKPTQIIGPDNKYLSVFTYLDITKQSHSFILDITNETVVKTLTPLINPKPVKPFEITFRDHSGKQQTLVLDCASETFLQIMEMAQELSVIPNVPLKNLPTDAIMGNKLIIPVVQENGNILQYTFDLNNQDTVKRLIQVSTSDLQTNAITVYLNDLNGKTCPIRLDVNNPNVLETLQVTAEDISAAYTFKTALVFVVNDNDKRDFVILDKDDKQMVEAFISSFVRQRVTTTTNCTILNLVDDNGNTVEIKLDLYDRQTISILKELQHKYTPKVIKPFVVKMPNGQLPLIVFSLKESGSAVSIVLDLNNQEVLSGLRKLHVNEITGKHFVVPIPGPNPEELFISIDNQETIKQLLHLCQFTSPQPTPLLLPSTDFVMTILDVDMKPLKIHLDTKDQLVLQELIEISKQSPQYCNCYVSLITDSYGSTIPIRIDTTNHVVINQLINLGRRFVYPKRYKVIPRTGYVSLQVFDIPIGTFSFPITIDCNNDTVLNMINQQTNNLKPGAIPIKIMACEQKGMAPILIDMDDKNLPVFLTGLSVLSTVILNPMVIITKPGYQPLLNMLIEVDFGQAAVTLDLNDENVISRLTQVQPAVKVDVTTFFYERQGVKYSLHLDLKDTMTLGILKEVTLTAPIRLIPVIYKQPILMITIGGGERIRLDLSNQIVVSELEKISLTTTSIDCTYIEISSKYNLPRPIYLDLNNAEVIAKLQQLATYTPPLTALVLPNRRHKVILPNPIIRGPITDFPITTFYIQDFGPVCIDLNIEEVRYLTMPFTHGNEPENPTFVMIPHISGDVYILRLNLFEFDTLNILKTVTDYCPVYYEPLEDVNKYIIAINLPKKVIHLDLNRTDVIEAIKALSRPKLIGKIYTIYLENIQGSYSVFNIDIHDVKTQEIFYKLERPKLPPFPFELKYQDLDMSVWKIVIDVNNYEVMDELIIFSQNTTTTIVGDASQIISLKLMSPQGRLFDVKLDKTNPRTLQILKELTVRSTQIEAELVIKPKPKNLQYIEIVDRQGATHQVAIDVNNLSVLRKLQQIIDSQDNGPKTMVSFKMPDGSTRQIQIDVSDQATIENLLKLSIESERGIPAQLVRIKPPKKVIPILMSFPVTAPFVGSFSVTVDVGKVEIVERLRALASSFVVGRSEFELNLRDSNGKEILLKLDLTNSTTLYKLVMLTIDSTGHNPTGIDPIEILNHVIYVPDVITVEIPDGYEMLPLSFDRSLPEVIAVLKRLPPDTRGHSTTWELLENKTPIPITIDSTTVNTQTALRAIGIQTLLPHTNAIEKSLLYGLFFLHNKGGSSPILLDLSKRETVVALIKLTKLTGSHPNIAYFEVRDDFSQYVTIGLDLTNPQVVQTLLSISTQPPIEINAKRLPYLIICLPNPTGYKCIKIKLKLQALDLLEKLPGGNGSYPINIIDAFDTNRKININPNDESLFNLLSTVDFAGVIPPPLTTNIMIIYVIEMDEASPVYVDLTSPKVIDLLIELDAGYNPRFPLAIVSYQRELARQYFCISLDDELIRMLSKDTAIVRGHSIIKQKPWQKTTISVPSPDGGQIAIALDMADKEVVAALKELSNNFGGSGSETPSLIHLEDAYGFPFRIKLNLYDEKTIGQLIRLSNKRRIV